MSVQYDFPTFGQHGIERTKTHVTFQNVKSIKHSRAGNGLVVLNRQHAVYRVAFAWSLTL